MLRAHTAKDFVCGYNLGEEATAADNDPSINFSDYDSDGDGEVDLAIVFTPREFGTFCGANGTAIHVNYTTTHSSTPTPVRVRNVVTSDHSNTFRTSWGYWLTSMGM